ncbi:hypothetical protein BpHYR1_043781 [Brachionus plicatilis]|uniref:Uncharacterized protein n=1 Tax=Brachionus plicatilis TaxID=10195 RepID=A0A3M7RKG6_BRAPC|nr:hypothetical protein BpHYR1_043781 [Brachionus plicatilis]
MFSTDLFSSLNLANHLLTFPMYQSIYLKIGKTWIGWIGWKFTRKQKRDHIEPEDHIVSQSSRQE